MPRSLMLSLSAVIVSAGIGHADAVRSAGILEFGPSNTLFVADSAAGAIHAYQLPAPDGSGAEDGAFNLLDLDAPIADALGIDGRIVYGDLAVHPVTGDAYVSLSAEIGGETNSAIVAVSKDGAVRQLDLAALSSTSVELQDKPDDAVTFWRDIAAPTLTVTDLDFANGELFVSGISTGEFASTLRRIPYPFDGSSAASSIEMYHAAHGQNETRAPIRAMAVLDLDGASTVVAAYTCTPLVTIPVDALQDQAHVTGKTIAELGYGNTPLDVIAFSAANRRGELANYVLVVNREMDADLIAMDALTAADAAPGLSTPIPYLGASAGVETISLPMSGVAHVADQSAQFLVALRRDLDTGAMELVSFRKGAFFRLSDFISEYNFPDYAYAADGSAQGVRIFQNMLKADEGFTDQIRE